MKIRAVYKNKVLKPLGKLDLKKDEEVEIKVRRIKDLSEQSDTNSLPFSGEGGSGGGGAPG